MVPFAIKVVFIYAIAILVLCSAFFAPAGTFDYWQAWVYMAALLVPAGFVSVYFTLKNPEFLERRLRTREKEAKQALLIRAALFVFVIAFLVPGLDRRFGWSNVPGEISIAADALVLAGYALVFLVFKENEYAGRTVEVEKGQKVISSGPYSIVRHPMYLGQLVMYTATPIALGSYVALPLFLLFIPVMVYRLLNEEELLGRELPGYKEYCKKTRYRLVPYVW